MLRVLSLFSGIGAFETALRRGGYQFETVNYCEIDPYASKAYSQIHDIPEGKNLHDVREINPLLLDNINLVTYGFPCQDISVAGKQKGFEYNGERTRSGLFFEALRIIEFLQPEYAICENVKALTSKKFEKEFNTVLSSLAEVGYNNYWKVLNAKDYGIPQNRERVFIISIRKDIDTGAFTFPEKQELKLRVKDILENGVDEKYYINTEKARQLIKKLLDKNRITGVEVCDATVNAPNVRDISNAIISRYDAGISNQRSWGTAVIEPHVKRLGNLYSETAGGARAGNTYDPEGLSPTLQTAQGGNRQPLIIEPPVICASRGRNLENPSDRTAGIPTEQRLEPNTDGVSNTLTTVQKDNYLLEAPKINVVGNLRGHSQMGRVFSTDGLSGCLSHADAKEPIKIMVSEPKIKIVGRMDGYERTGRVYSSNGIACNLLAREDSMQILEEPVPKGGQREVKILETTQEAYRIRKLTPRECFRLMGFSDSDFDKIKGISNTQLYKMAGNSIVVNVLEGIFRELFKAQSR